MPLYVLQFAKIFLPWISVPYLLRTLGPASYGDLAFAQGLVQYCLLFSDYGYRFVGPRQFALVRPHSAALNDLVSEVLVTQLLFGAIGLFVLWAISWFVPQISDRFVLILLLSGIVAGTSLQQYPVFQGLGQLQTFAGVSLFTKTLETIAIFVFIKDTLDLTIVASIYSISNLVAGIVLLLILSRIYGYKFSFPSFGRIRNVIRRNKVAFGTSLLISMYTSANVVVLGLFSTPVVVGWFAAGEKIVRAAQMMLVPIHTVLFPRFSRMAKNSRDEGIRLLMPTASMYVLIAFVPALLFILVGRHIVELLFGPSFSPASDVVRIMSMLPAVMAITLVTSNLFLLGFGYTRIWSTLLVWTSFVAITSAMVLVGILDLRYIGSALTVMAAEVFLMLASARVMYKRLRKNY